MPPSSSPKCSSPSAKHIPKPTKETLLPLQLREATEHKPRFGFPLSGDACVVRHLALRHDLCQRMKGEGVGNGALSKSRLGLETAIDIFLGFGFCVLGFSGDLGVGRVCEAQFKGKDKET